MSYIHIFIPGEKVFDCVTNSTFCPLYLNELYQEQEKDHSRNSKYLKRDKYFELIALRWVLQHDKSEYIGFFMPKHYLSFVEQSTKSNAKEPQKYDFLDELQSDNHNFEEDFICNVVKKYDAIVSEPIIVDTVEDNYSRFPARNRKDLEVLSHIIEEHFVEYIDAYKKYISGNEYYSNHLFIMKHEIFERYTNFLFCVLSYFEIQDDDHDYGYDMKKVFCYCAEILLGAFIVKMKGEGANIGIRQQYKISKVDIENKLTPVFTSNYVPVVLTYSESYYMPVCVTLQSVLDTISSSVNYDIIIVHADLSVSKRKMFERMVKGYANVSLRFYDISKDMRNCAFQSAHPFVSHVTVESYYRILVQSVFVNYDRIIWLDSDMIIKCDVSELYQIELGDNLLAGAIDPGWHAMMNDSRNDEFREYVRNVLKLPEDHKYIQQGTLLINVKEFNKQFNQQELIQYASSYEFMFYDQDIYNVISKGKVQYLDMKWNVLADVGGDRVDAICSLAPISLCDEYMKAREDPYVIHFAGGTKPWQVPTIDYAYEFWNTARHTEIYEPLLQSMMKKEAEGSFQLATKMSQHRIDKAVRKIEGKFLKK